MIKELLFVAIALFAGIFAYMHTHGISMITQITSIPNTLTNLAQSVVTFLANNKYTSLIAGGGITLIGILTRQWQNMKAKATAALSTAEAWKNETFQMNDVTKKLLQEKKDLEAQVKTLKQTNPTILELTKSRDEAQALVTQQKRTIDSQKATITELHRVIQETKQKVVTKTNVI